jgi:hypothetical protein
MEYQVAPFGALVFVHVTPPLVEVKMPPPYTAAASRVPSAEEAMEDQFSPGALVGDLAERLATSKDQAEIARLRSAMTRGFYGE